MVQCSRLSWLSAFECTINISLPYHVIHISIFSSSMLWLCWLGSSRATVFWSVKSTKGKATWNPLACRTTCGIYRKPTRNYWDTPLLDTLSHQLVLRSSYSCQNAPIPTDLNVIFQKFYGAKSDPTPIIKLLVLPLKSATHKLQKNCLVLQRKPGII